MSAVITRRGERIIVRFPARPEREVIRDMRGAGFAWSQAKRAWMGDYSADAERAARAIAACPAKPAGLIETAIGSVIHGDCIDVLPQLPAACIDFVLTDPPYLVGYRDRSGRRLRGDRDGAWMNPAFAAIARVMKPGTLMLCFYGWQAADQFLAGWRAAGLQLVDHMVAYKDYASSSRYFSRRHEMAYLLAKGKPPLPARPLADVRTHWPYTGNRHHPTEKPAAALRPLIESLCLPQGLVLDPFAGSASAGIAAQKAGRRFIGIEIDRAVHAAAVKRLRARSPDGVPDTT